VGSRAGLDDVDLNTYDTSNNLELKSEIKTTFLKTPVLHLILECLNL
jgi:hypothetical protein